MSSTSGSWEVGGALTVTGASTFTGAVTCNSTLYASGLATFHGNFTFGTTGSYLTDGKYNWLFSDGDGVKFHAVKVWDIVNNAYRKMYCQDGAMVTTA